MTPNNLPRRKALVRQSYIEVRPNHVTTAKKLFLGLLMIPFLPLIAIFILPLMLGEAALGFWELQQKRRGEE